MKIIHLLLFALVTVLLVTCHPLSAQTSPLEKEAERLIEEGNQFHLNSQYDSTIARFLSARALFLEAGNREKAIERDLLISRQYDAKGEQARRSFYLDRALEEGEAHLPKGHPHLANAYMQKGEVFLYTGALDSAAIALQVATQLYQSWEENEEEDWRSLGFCHILIGVLGFYLGDTEAAKLDFEKALQVAEAHLDPQSDVYATAYQNLAVLYELGGDYEKSVELAEKGLRARLNLSLINSTDSSFISASYNNLGGIYQEKGDFDLAIEYLQKAILIERALKTPNISTLGSAMNNLALAISLKGEPETALEIYKERQALLTDLRDAPSDSKELALSQNDMAYAYLQLEQPDSALYWLHQALKYIPPLDAKTDQHAYVYRNIGRARIQLGQYEAALDTLRMASAQFRQMYAADHPLFAETELEMGRAWEELEQADSAFTAYEKGISLLSDATHNTILIHLYTRKAALLKRLGRVEEANAASQTAISLLEALWRDFLTPGAKKMLFANWLPAYETAIATSLDLYEQTGAQTYLLEAFSLSEKTRSAILLDDLQDRRASEFSGVPVYLREHERSLALDIAFYDAQLEAAKMESDTTKAALYAEYLFNFRRGRTRLQQNLRKEYPQYHQSRYEDRNVDLEAIRSQLDEDALFLELFDGEKEVFVFVLSKEEMEVHRLKKDPTWEADLARFRRSLRDYDYALDSAAASFRDFTQGGHSLYTRLLAPVLEGKTATQLVIAPDGALAYIPFDALITALPASPTPDFLSLDYLLHQYSVSYAWSGQLLVENRNRPRQPSASGCLAFAPAEDLEATRGELTFIDNLFGGQFYFGTDATAQRFREAAQHYRLIHLAMHAVTDARDPALSRLVFPTPL